MDGWKPREKASEQGEHKQQTQATWDGEYGNRTRVSEVGGEPLSTMPPVLNQYLYQGGGIICNEPYDSTVTNDDTDVLWSQMFVWTSGGLTLETSAPPFFTLRWYIKLT